MISVGGMHGVFGQDDACPLQSTLQDFDMQPLKAAALPAGKGDDLHPLQGR
jgi:hypothetical protein